MAHKSGLGARRKEAHLKIAIDAIGGEYEGHIDSTKFAREREHGGLLQKFPVEHHARGIAGTRRVGKRVHAEDP
jgi:hypothetical protein